MSLLLNIINVSMLFNAGNVQRVFRDPPRPQFHLCLDLLPRLHVYYVCRSSISDCMSVNIQYCQLHVYGRHKKFKQFTAFEMSILIIILCFYYVRFFAWNVRKNARSQYQLKHTQTHMALMYSFLFA